MGIAPLQIILQWKLVELGEPITTCKMYVLFSVHTLLFKNGFAITDNYVGHKQEKDNENKCNFHYIFYNNSVYKKIES